MSSSRRAWVVLPLLVIITLLGFVIMYTTQMPGRSYTGALKPLTPPEETIRDGLKKHVEVLAGEIGERNMRKYGELQAAAEYIEHTLKDSGYNVAEQTYPVDGKEVRNIEAESRGINQPEQIIVIGAHYDSVPDCPAANDNGSGIAAALEIARLLKTRPLAKTIRFVAFPNEESPYFGTQAMGSLRYAERSRQRKERIVAMFSLETMGYYSDVPGSQRYPFPFSLFYPSTGNFIGFVGNIASRALVRRTVNIFRDHANFPSEGVASPSNIPGIGWSDQWAFWQMGYPALMVTDTAPFRYPHYHTPQDTPDKIDYDRLARVVGGLAHVVIGLASD